MEHPATTTMDPPITAYLRAAVACMVDPLSIAAIGLLLVNDHFLKTAFPSWITGKVSDFAGLYFTPFFGLVILFGGWWIVQRVAVGTIGGQGEVRHSTAKTLSLSVFIVTAVLFAAVKSSSLTAGPLLRLIWLVTGQWRLVVVDPTDLFPLSVIPLAYGYWTRKLTGVSKGALLEKPRSSGLLIQARGVAPLLVIVVAAVAMVATSPSPVTQITSIAVNPQNPKLLYSVQAYKSYSTTLTLFRSGDGGSTWESRGQGPSRVIADPGHADRFYLVGSQGLQRLTDDPFTIENIWKPEPSQMGGLVDQDWDKIAIETPSTDPDTIYVGFTGSILRTKDGGSTWSTLLLPGSNERIVTAIASTPAKPGLLFAVKDGSVYRSDDWGNTWTELSNFSLPPHALKVHPKNPDLLVAANYDAIHRSADGGRTWKEVWTDRPATPNPLVKPASPNYWGREWAIAFDPENEKAVYVVSRGRALLASFDLGQSWQTLLDNNVFDVAVAPTPNHRVYLAAGSRGVYRQRSDLKPNGQGWEKTNKGLDIKS